MVNIMYHASHYIIKILIIIYQRKKLVISSQISSFPSVPYLQIQFQYSSSCSPQIFRLFCTIYLLLSLKCNLVSIKF